jgi:hypothetical protein
MLTVDSQVHADSLRAPVAALPMALCHLPTGERLMRFRQRRVDHLLVNASVGGQLDDVAIWVAEIDRLAEAVVDRSAHFHAAVATLFEHALEHVVADGKGLVARIGHLAARGGGYRRVSPFLTPDRHRAIQNEPRSPPSHPEAAAQGDELGRL